MNGKDEHQHCNQDGRSGIANVGQVPAVCDPFEEVAPAENEDRLSEEPEEYEDAEADEDWRLVACHRAHAVVVALHRVCDLFMSLGWGG